VALPTDIQEPKPGLIVFRRADMKHKKWCCRIKLPLGDRYKSVSLKTADIDAARERAFDQDADLASASSTTCRLPAGDEPQNR
jgi:integrase